MGKTYFFGSMISVFDDKDKNVKNGCNEENDEDEEVEAGNNWVRVLHIQIVKNAMHIITIEQCKQRYTSLV